MPACRPPTPQRNPCLYALNVLTDTLPSGTIGGALFGFDVSSMSAWIGSEQYLEYFGHPDSDTQGGITASMSAGSFIGSLAAGWLCDHMGRRGILQVASVIWVIGAALQCSAQNIAHLIVGRIVSGLASKLFPVHGILVPISLTPFASRYHLVPSLCLPCRARPSQHPRPHCRRPTVGYRLGHFDNVPHLIRLCRLYQRPFVLPRRMGCTRHTRDHSWSIFVLLPRVPSLARQ